MVVLRRTFLCILALAAVPGPGAAQDRAAQDRATRADALLAERKGAAVPGCAASVFVGGARVYAGAVGSANLELGVPVTGRTTFDAGSIAKQFTAACLVLLEQDKKLSIEDDVTKYLPELAPLGQRVTIRQLLNHTSGMRDAFILAQLAGREFEDALTKEDMIGLLARQRGLNAPPGERFEYVNSGYFLAAIVAERVSGRPLADLARERIFEPLGMRDTRFRARFDEPVPNRATPYAKGEGGYRIAETFRADTGPGGLYTTAEDLARWEQNFVEPKVGGAAFVETMLEEGRLRSGKPTGYALGVWVEPWRGARAITHGGSSTGLNAFTVVLPESRLSVAVTCNCGDASADRYALGLAAIFREEAAPAPASRPAAQAGASTRPTPAATGAPAPRPARLAGVYGDVATETVRRFEARGETLVLVDDGAETKLVEIQPGTFEGVVGGRRLRFEFAAAADGTAKTALESVEVWRGAWSDQPLERLELVDPGKVDFAAYEGTFRSDELGRAWKVRPAAGGLALEWKEFREPTKLKPYRRDEFAGKSFVLRFKRAADGRVVGFVLDAPRAEGIRFDRAP